MSVIRIATRYAKSLLDLAIEQNKLESVQADMQSLYNATRNRDLLMLLKSPIIDGSKKVAILEAIFKGKIDDLTMSYLRLLVNKGREAYLSEIAAEFAAQYKILRNITSVRVTSAIPLEEKVLADLRAKLQASGVATDNLEIETKIDPELIGGFVLEFDDKRYDASISHKLEQLKSQFSKNLYIKEY